MVSVYLFWSKFLTLLRFIYFTHWNQKFWYDLCNQILQLGTAVLYFNAVWFFWWTMAALWGSCQYYECVSHYAKIVRLDHSAARSFAWMNSTVLDTFSISSVKIVNSNGQCVTGLECDFWNESCTERKRVNVTDWNLRLTKFFIFILDISAVST
jgi:hypothetical protein